MHPRDHTKSEAATQRLAYSSFSDGNTREGGCWDVSLTSNCDSPRNAYLSSDFLENRDGSKNRGYEVLLKVPCRKCEKCLRFRQMQWRERALHEIQRHPYNYFVTLTFSPAHLAGIIYEANVQNKPLETVAYSHVAKYWKRLRKGRSSRMANAQSSETQGRKRQVFDPLNLRYIGIFELGDENGRPHFHMLIHLNRWVPAEVLTDEWRSRADAELVRSREGSATYITKYLTKTLGGSRIRASQSYGDTPPTSLEVEKAEHG